MGFYLNKSLQTSFSYLVFIMNDYIKACHERFPSDLSQDLGKIEELYAKKLWHQLTVLLQNFVKNEFFNQGTELIEMYKCFISDFEKKINPLALVEILCPYVIRQFGETKEALEFLESVREKTKESDEATILCLTAMGNIHLLANDHAATKKTIEMCE